MTDLMRALYEFTEEQRLEKHFLRKEYEEYHRAAYRKFDEIVAEYPQVHKKLNDMVSDLNACSSYEYEAAFQVGFLLRGELGRIQNGYSSLFL